MTDKTIRFGKTLLQHGNYNDRVYLMKLSKADFPAVIAYSFKLARENGYSKIIAKIPKWAKRTFEERGYTAEAHIPNFFMGEDDAYFMAYYFDKARTKQADWQEAEQILGLCEAVEPAEGPLELASNFHFEILSPEDTEEMTSVYRRVFETYPFPIFDTDYLKKTMQKNIVYFGIRTGGRLVALSSCEMDPSSKNVEMTDFATLPEFRAKGLASFLVQEMEHEMIKRGIYTAYTIARSLSYGMNITFAKHNYSYCGTLVNNTDISGAIESMNVWYKTLMPAKKRFGHPAYREELLFSK